MAKRKYTHIKIIEPKLLAMREAGKTNRELAEYFGLEIRQIENWVNRYHREQARFAEGLPPKRRGVPENIRHQPTFKSISMRLSV